ncbi:MAG: DUF547 domain-containing protein [Elusimicrobia bacterium]|nr:DUF547 domain-containing protein [Elusimicrobiota bacterium]
MKTQALKTFALLVCFAAPSWAAPFDRTFARYDSLLKEHVSKGRVDYAALKKAPGGLDAVLAELAGAAPEEYGAWKEPDRIAFWLNAYNAQTLKAIVDNYPIEARGLAALRFPKNSIRQIPGVWDKRGFVVMGRTMTLDGIEHSVLRKEFKEPRAHMALVCASIGCPPLRAEAYRGDRLEAQLEDQARTFLSDKAKFRIDQAAARVGLSPIFKWFGGDFVGRWGGAPAYGTRTPEQSAVLRFISERVGPQQREFLAAGVFTVEFLDYDWSLNEKGR